MRPTEVKTCLHIGWAGTPVLAIAVAAMLVLIAASVRAQVSVNVQFSTKNGLYSGTGPALGTGTTWNAWSGSSFTPNLNGVTLTNANGVSTSVTVTVTSSSNTNTFNGGGSGTLAKLLGAYMYAQSGIITITIGGLVPGNAYDVYCMGTAGNYTGCGARFSNGGVTNNCGWNPVNFSTWVAGQNYVEFGAVTANWRSSQAGWAIIRATKSRA